MVYNELNEYASLIEVGDKGPRSSARTGIRATTFKKYLETQSMNWHPTMKIGSGCRVHLRANELPEGRLIVRVSGHVTAVVDGVLLDNHDCSRGGMRCVYGFWRCHK